MTVHQTSLSSSASLTLEVKDAHSKELVALRTDPSYPAGQRRRLCEDVASAVRATLLALLDPDPF